MKVYNSFIIDPYLINDDSLDKLKTRTIRIINKCGITNIDGLKFSIVEKQRKLLDNLYSKQNLEYKNNHYVILDTKNVITTNARYRINRCFCIDKESYTCYKENKRKGK